MVKQHLALVRPVIGDPPPQIPLKANGKCPVVKFPRMTLGFILTEDDFDRTRSRILTRLGGESDR